MTMEASPALTDRRPPGPSAAWPLQQIADLVGGVIEGDRTVLIRRLAKIEEAGEGDLTFIANPKYEKYMETTQASAVLVRLDFPATPKTTIRVADPYFAFMRVARWLQPEKPVERGVHPTALVGEGTRLAPDVSIGPYVVIGARCVIGARVRVGACTVIGQDVEIGEDSVLYPGVCLADGVKLHNRVVVHSGAVIGSEGFGFAKGSDGTYQRIPQMGTVVIEDDVDIGANCCIDRATLGETRIRRGVKLDNLIQVAHNVEIGEDTVIAAQTGISGSTKIGQGVVIAGQVGFVGHIEIGDHSVVGAQSGVSKSVPPRTVVFGYPAKPMAQAKREEAALRQLPQLIKRVRELEKQIKQLKNSEGT